MNEIIKAFPADTSPLWVSMAGITCVDSSYHIRRECADVTVIEYVVKGEGYITVDGQPRLITAGQVYVQQAGERHDYYSRAANPWEKIFINVNGELPTALLQRYGLWGRYVFDGVGLRDTFRRVAEIVRRPRESEDDTRLEALFFEALVRLAKGARQESHSQEAVRLKEYLDAHTERLVGNAELAAAVYRSPDYCIKLFRREYGTTPYDYQIGEKLRIARRLLRDTTLPVAQIAARVGYPDAGYFSGLFRRKCGLSPREYRQGK